MKLITKYVANDGYEFNTEKHCLAHENLLLKIEDVHKLLGSRAKDVGCEFSNGAGYIQHTKNEVFNFKKALVALCKSRVRDDVFKLPLDKIYPGGIASRILSETNPRLYQVWSRLCCIDEYNREWGQPYYALNPTKGAQEKWKYLVSKK